MIEYCVNCNAGVAWGSRFTQRQFSDWGKNRVCPRCKENFDVVNPVDKEGKVDLTVFVTGRGRSGDKT